MIMAVSFHFRLVIPTILTVPTIFSQIRITTQRRLNGAALRKMEESKVFGILVTTPITTGMRFRKDINCPI